MPDALNLPWRVGRKVGRTIYADTPELARAAVAAHNTQLGIHP